MSRIPFESPDFGAEELEEFVARFLNAGVSLSVDGPDGVEERRILRAYRSNKTGGVSDGGVDVVATVEGGETWGFQCKLKSKGQKKRWTLAMSRSAAKEATYRADRYFLVVIAPNGSQREAVDYIEGQEKWEFWDGDVLSSQFLTRVSLEEGSRILEEFFDKNVAENSYGLLRDDVLIPASRFFESFSDDNAPFNHTTRLVGRDSVIDSLHAFVEDSQKKVLLVAAKGGEGKSRVLREFGLQFDSQHSDWTLRFVNPFARNDSEKSLGYLLKKNLVAVHEDAHRIETLRSSILSAVAHDKNAKLILTVRPQGIEAVRGILRDHGIGVDDIEPLSAWSPLSEAEMVELAEAVLGPSPEIEPRVLAGMSDRSPLICVVGGNLIRTRRLSPQEIPDSDAFRNEVFDRFEQQNLEIISRGNPDRQELLKRLLRALAALAPYSTDRESEKKLAGFLDLRWSLLDERFTELEAAEIISKTGKGWRVGPDLFADHLVYTSCVRKGQSSAFCDELIETFGAEHFAALLRNLSEAEWRSRMNDSETADLTSSLWNQFQKKFEKSRFWDRREMLGSWSAFSVFLPEKSIELTKLAIALDKAPKDEVSPLVALNPGTHRQVVETVPNLLKPIGIYHPEQRFEAFDILARLGRGWSPEAPLRMREEDNHPWVVIGKAASFALDQPMDSIRGVVQWIRSRLETNWFAELVDRRCSFITVVLEPIFKRTIERTYSQGMSVIFETIPISAEKTAAIRDDAYKLIETTLIPRSEIAALNVIPVLRSAIPVYGVGPDGKVDPAEWQSSRVHAIELLGKCLECWDSPFVRFSVWQALTPRIPYEKDKVIVESARKVLGDIQHDLSFSEALVTLGDGSDFRLDEDLDAEPDYQRSWEKWKEFVPKVAAEILEEFPGNEALVHHFIEFNRDARTRGFLPNWSPLLNTIAQTSGTLAMRWIEQTLKGECAFLESHAGSLIEMAPEASDEEKDKWLASAIKSERTDLKTSALRTLRWRKEAPGNQTVRALVSLLQSPNKADRNLATEAVGDPIASGNEWGLKLLTFIPFQDLDEAAFSEFVNNLVKAINYQRLTIDLKELRPIIDRMEQIQRIYKDPYPDFLHILSEESPRETYELIRKRIERFEALNQTEENYSFTPVPQTLQTWSIPGLEKEADFETIVQFLIDRVRNSESNASDYWVNLFQAAVLMNGSPLGIAVLRDWLSQVEDVEALAGIAEVFNLRGSRLVFRNPDFAKELLVRAAEFSTEADKRIRNLLIPDTSGRGFSNGKLDPKYHWVLEEAQKAASAHASDPVLKSFFDAVIERELRIREQNMEEYQDRMLAMG